MSVLHFTFAKLVQMRGPARDRGQIVGDAFREQNVTGVTKIHDALRDVDPGAGDVRVFVQIDNAIHRAAVNAHAHLNLRTTLQGRRNFRSAFDHRLRIGEKNERHSIARR